MYYFAHIALGGFYAAVHRQNQLPEDKPLIVHRDKQVLDLNSAALRLGLTIGMGLREAKTMIGDSSCLIAWEEQTYRIRHERWLDVVCEHVEELFSEDQHEALIDLAGQPAPAEFAHEVACRLEGHKFGKVEIGVGATPWIARLASMPLTDGIDEQSVHDPAGFLAPRRIEDLLPVDPEHRRRLRFLGYRTIGEVANIAPRVLKGQFGEDAARISLSANGRWQEPFRPNYPLDKAAARLANAYGWVDWQALHRAYEALAKKLRSMLKKRDSCVRFVCIDFYMESGDYIGQSRTFSKPMSTAKDLVRAMAILTPKFREPVVEIVVRLLDLEPIVRKQRQLDGTHEVRERKLSAENAFKAIRTVYGDQSIQTAAEIEIPRSSRVMRVWKDATGWR